MSGTARVESIEVIRAFRTALVKFAEAANTALADSEAEAQRAQVWLETEQETYWTGQIRKRHELVERCKDAVRQKKLYKSPTGNTQSAVEEEKALRIAQARLEEADQKLKNVRRWAPRLQKEIAAYKGGVGRLTTTVLADIPVAVSRLDKMIAALMQYAALTISGSGVMEGLGEAAQSMARAAAELAGKPDYSPLRTKTAGIDRTKATPGSVALEKWSDGLATEREREMVVKIEATRVVPKPDQFIIVEQSAWQSARIFLERVLGEGDDSGWFLGRGDGVDGPALLKVPIADLIAARTDLTEILALPAGYLVAIDLGGITTILNEKGDDVWSPLSAS